MALASLTFSAGCTIEPAYQRPPVALPMHWDAATASNTAMPTTEIWWRGFGDPQLVLLLQHAVDHNPDLAIAVDRVMEAQDMITVAHAAKLPVIGFTGLPTDPVSTQLRTTASGRLDVDSNIFELAFNASYELDFWGKLRAQENAAHSDYRASVSDAGTVQIGLLSSVARGYFELRAIDETLQIDQRRLDIAQQRLKLTQLRLTAGRIGSTPVAEAQLAISDIEARMSSERRERTLNLSTLAVLTGDMPETLKLDAAPLRGTVQLQPIPVGLPSSLLSRRPDLLAAEAHLQTAHSQITVAHAALLPEVALTAKAGFVSGATRNLAKAGSTVFGIGPDVSLPIFDGGRLKAELDASRWRNDAAMIEYRKAILGALAEVEHALLDYQGAVESVQRNADDTAVQQKQAHQIDAEIEAGRSTRFDALAAQERLLDRDVAALLAYQQQLASLVAMYQALGGGWNPDQPIEQRTLVGAADDGAR
jgi:NodT family efflux transporter outer membrane factor (OMF) lipoprotein